MAPSTLVKRCAACGADCADRPRTKDTRGNYFCKPCFDDLLARKQRGEKIAIRVAGGRGPSQSRPDDALDGLAIDDDSPLASLDLGASRTGTGVALPPPVAACPRCGAGVSAGAALCVACGTDLRSGASLRTAVSKGPREGGVQAGPIVFGIGGILVGSIGVLIGLALLAAAAVSVGSSVVTAVVAAVFALVYLWLGGVHLLGAIDTLRRIAVGPDRMRLTAGVYIGLTVVGTVAQVKLMSGALKGEMTTGELVGQSIVGTVIVCIWPMAVLVWTSRKATRDMIKRWG